VIGDVLPSYPRDVSAGKVRGDHWTAARAHSRKLTPPRWVAAVMDKRTWLSA